MASRAELEQQAAVNTAVLAMAWEQFEAGWDDLAITAETVTATATVASVVDLFAQLLTVWGDVAATTAADFYDDLRDQAGVDGTFEVVLADPVNTDQVAGVVRWALNPWPQRVIEDGSERLPTPEEISVDAMRDKVQGPLQRLVRQTGRATIDRAAASDPARPRVARVPMGAETCAFCLVLAARGPVYRSVETAGQDVRYHDFDDCEQVLVFTDNPAAELPEGYDPGELYAKYQAARRTAGSSELRTILRQLRLQEGIR